MAHTSARSRKNGYYEILGVSTTSRSGDIKAGYMEIVKKHHPDRAGADNAESKAIFEVRMNLNDIQIYFAMNNK